MKKFLIALVIFLLVIVIAAVGAVAYVYYTYFLPQPAEFEFIAPISEMTKVEVISVTKLPDNKLELKPLSSVEDTEAFLSEFAALECHKGLSVSALGTVAELNSLEAIKITYADGSYEIITAYGNLDSGIFSPDFTPEILLEREYYFFDSDEFKALIDKYSAAE